MDNIFTLHKYDDEADDFHLNIDDLYEKKREKDDKEKEKEEASEPWWPPF